MFRKTITTLAAAAIALTTFAAAPASARDGDDLVKFLAGATALVVIGNAISDSKKDKKKYTEAHMRPKPKPQYRDQRDYRWNNHDRRDAYRYNNHDRRDAYRYDNRRDERSRYNRHDDRRQGQVSTCYTRNVGRNDTRTYCSQGRR